MKKQIICIFLVAVMLLCLCPAASAFSEMSFSDELVAYIKQGEGFVANAISDGTGWYIGYGCQVNPSDYPGGITEPQADALLRQKMQSFADSVNSFCRKYGISVTQGQFDAMCGMSYALGPGWMKAGNRLPDYLIAGIDGYTDQQIASAFAAWCHVGGAVNTVALRRRIMEAKMFLYEDYSFTADGWGWVILDANGGQNAQSDVAVYPNGEPYGVLPEVSRSGYYFAGWQTESGDILKETDTVSGNLKLKAVWSSTPVETAPTESSPVSGETPKPVEPVTELEPPAEEAVPGEEVSVSEEAEPSDALFSDVPEGEWYTPYVTELAGAGVVNGYEDGTFRPKASVTWGQALKLILLASGYPEQKIPETGHWASAYLNYAVKQYFVSNSAVPGLDAPITRNDMADLCAAALELKTAASPTPYADSNRASVLKLYAAELMVGSVENGNRLFKGSNAITRAEICAVLVRVMEYVDENLIIFKSFRLPLDTSLRQNSYDPEAFSMENGRMTYDDGNITGRIGIDVSEHQGEIDWAAVAADGITFAMIRCGYRGYGTGSLNEDPYFRKNIAGALANGLDVGVYFFSQALTAAEAKEEAEYALALIEGYDLTFPVVFDWEVIETYSSRTRNYPWGGVADLAEAFCDTVAAAGYTPMVYFNPALAYLYMDLTKAQNYAGWLANYVEKTEYRYDFQMWQYGSDGNVAGVRSLCDLNLCLTDFSEWK